METSPSRRKTTISRRLRLTLAHDAELRTCQQNCGAAMHTSIRFARPATRRSRFLCVAAGKKRNSILGWVLAFLRVTPVTMTYIFPSTLTSSDQQNSDQSQLTYESTWRQRRRIPCRRAQGTLVRLEWARGRSVHFCRHWRSLSPVEFDALKPEPSCGVVGTVVLM
jgi:hypothetical protein